MKSLCILVVENDALVGTLLAEMLGDMGHHVDGVVTTQADAIEAAARARPDLIILDEHLRSGLGSSAMTEILKQRFVPHVLMSGAPLDDRQDGAIFLKKPFFEDDLRRALDLAMRARAPEITL